jgi:hypothetical protein
MTHLAQFEEKSAEELDRWCRGFLLSRAEDFTGHPQGSHKHMCRVSEERRLVALDQMAEPSQGESCRDQQQPNDPVEPHNHNRRKANWDGNHMQRPIYGMIVRAVVM